MVRSYSMLLYILVENISAGAIYVLVGYVSAADRK